MTTWRQPRFGRTHVLITGFQPFPTQPVNATAALAPAVAAATKRAFPDIAVSTAVLPTEWRRGPWTLDDLLLTDTPDILISFGIASRAQGFEIETRAQNACSDALDAAGCRADHEQLDAEAPAHLPASLPVQEIVRRLRRRRFPVIPSRNAGRCLCNAVLFQALRTAGRLPRLTRVGFIHVPAELPVPGRRQNAVNRSSPLSFADAVVGGADIVAACLGRALPRHAEQQGHAGRHLASPGTLVQH